MKLCILECGCRYDAPRPNAIVRISYASRAVIEKHKELWAGLIDLLAEDAFIFIGEIPNKPGRCVVRGNTGKWYVGHHTTHFEETCDACHE